MTKTQTQQKAKHMKTTQKSNKSNPAQLESASTRGNRRERREGVLKIEMRQRKKNRSLAVNEVLELLKKEAPGFWKSIAQVGSWLWLQIPGPYSRREANLLWRLGFHHSTRRNCFQHPCGSETGVVSNRDPRETYGITYPALQH